MARKSIARWGVPVLVALMTFVTSGASAQKPPSPEQIHNELRALKDRAVDAVNKRNKDALFRELAPNITFTAMDNEVISGLEKLRAYYDQTLASPSRLISSTLIEMKAWLCSATTRCSV